MMRQFILLCLLLTLSMTYSEAQESLSTCSDEQIAHAETLLGDYTPSEMRDFVRLEDNRFMIGDEVFDVRGINYYPANYPWRRFLAESDAESVWTELSLLQAANLNTLRIFVWNQAIFQCFGSGAVPNAGNFQRLDTFIQMAASFGFRLIVTLNDLPDLENHILYDNPEYIVQQTAYLVERYRDEAAILAWDMRNEGDINYGTHPNIVGNFERDTVLNWLNITSQNIQALDDNHLITAGWLYDAEATAPYVDFISFHHWTDSQELAERISHIQAVSELPILLQETGYSTFRVSEQAQADSLNEVLTAAEDANLLGWMVWTAFDFPLEATCYPSPCRSADNAEHHFGLWTSDYVPKPAVAVLQRD